MFHKSWSALKEEEDEGQLETVDTFKSKQLDIPVNLLVSHIPV